MLFGTQIPSNINFSVKGLWGDESGGAALEYGLILALVAGALTFGLDAISSELGGAMGAVAEPMAQGPALEATDD